MKVNAEDSGGPPILGSLRAEIAFDQCGLPQPSVDLESLQGQLDCAREVKDYTRPARKAKLSKKSVPERSG